MQDPNTLHVPYELFIKLPPWVKLLICEVQKPKSGNQSCKANFHGVYGITSADLAPDIMPVEQNFYETEVTEDATLEVGATTDNIGDDQQLLANLTPSSSNKDNQLCK